MPPTDARPSGRHDRGELADNEAAVALGAAACIDVWMGGDTSWRTREGDGPSQEFMAGADWIMAVALTKAVLQATAALRSEPAEGRDTAEAARAEMRERCARVVETEAAWRPYWDGQPIGSAIAAAIRAPTSGGSDA